MAKRMKIDAFCQRQNCSTLNHYRKSHIGCRMSIGSIDELGDLKFNVRIFTYVKAYLRDYATCRTSSLNIL